MQIDLITRLRGDAQLAALLGATGSRPSVDWVSRPNGSNTPSVTLTEVSTRPDYTQDDKSEWQEVVVQMDAWSDTVLTGNLIIDRLIALMQSRAIVGDTVFNRAFINGGPRNMRVEDLAGGERLNHKTVDFRFYHKPAN